MRTAVSSWAVRCWGMRSPRSRQETSADHGRRERGRDEEREIAAPVAAECAVEDPNDAAIDAKRCSVDVRRVGGAALRDGPGGRRQMDARASSEARSIVAA